MAMPQKSEQILILNNELKIKLSILLCLITTVCFAQDVDLENIGGFIGKGKPLKISGEIAVNNVFFNSNQNIKTSLGIIFNISNIKMIFELENYIKNLNFNYEKFFSIKPIILYSLFYLLRLFIFQSNHTINFMFINLIFIIL